MAVQLILDFDIQLLCSIFQRKPGATAIAPVQEVGPALCKLLRFPQVQGERTLDAYINGTYRISLISPRAD